MELVYQKNIIHTYSDVDFRGRSMPSSLFAIMQELGSAHADILGVGYSRISAMNITWVLVRTSLEMKRYPASGEKMTVRTWPGPERRMLFPRYYLFEDKDGNILGTASTLWALMDMTARNIVVPSSKNISVDIPAENPCQIPLPGKIYQPEGETAVSSLTPKYTDLDINGHVNNTKYVDWLTDMIPLEIHRNGFLSKISVNYSKEIRAEDTVTLSFSRNGDQFRLSGRNGDQQFFTINAIWESNI
ncbi:MAG: thioesterase [Spirochaetia bacterium]|nr:thioesterase [Spirochaetia bacterium]